LGAEALGVDPGRPGVLVRDALDERRRADLHRLVLRDARALRVALDLVDRQELLADLQDRGVARGERLTDRRRRPDALRPRRALADGDGRAGADRPLPGAGRAPRDVPARAVAGHVDLEQLGHDAGGVDEVERLLADRPRHLVAVLGAERREVV